MKTVVVDKISPKHNELFFLLFLDSTGTMRDNDEYKYMVCLHEHQQLGWPKLKHTLLLAPTR